MKGDFSRLTFDVTQHFSRVLMQQGRVQLDADWNEQTAILLHYLQSLAKDLIGEHGGPAHNLGFKIIVDRQESGKPKLSFVIGKGHYYIDGILCEVDRDYSFFDQPDYVGKPLDKSGNCLVYVDVWERHISSIEEEGIREVALGGPDTATRAKLVWQVKVESTIPDAFPENFETWRAWLDSQWLRLKNQWQPENRGMLKAQAKQDQNKATDPCITSPESSYRGTENQLYRVEIHRGGNPFDEGMNPNREGATFKWSRDNASIVTGIKLNDTELTVDNPRGFSTGQWVELSNDNQELRGHAGFLFKIKKIDGDIITLDDAKTIAKLTDKPNDVPSGEEWPTKARLWDSAPIQIIENDNTWITLADGVQIQFQPSTATPAHQYRTGDYWLIPARVTTGDVEWPGAEGKPEALPPLGVEHHYAPLAIINTGDGTLAEDLRWQIMTLVEKPTL